MSTYSSGLFFTFEDPTLLSCPALFLLFLRPTLRTADYSGPGNDGGGRGGGDSPTASTTGPPQSKKRG